MRIHGDRILLNTHQVELLRSLQLCERPEHRETFELRALQGLGLTREHTDSSFTITDFGLMILGTIYGGTHDYRLSEPRR